MKAAIIAVGDELLNGQTIDTNSAWLAQRLNEVGVQVLFKQATADQHDEIIEALERATSKVDLILMTGGLGPTKDDITKKSIADYVGDEMVFDQGTYERIENLFTARGLSITDAHRQQCYMPSSTTLLSNPRGTAPGMWIERPDFVILSMPGVPNEMKAIMNAGALQRIKEKYKGQVIEHSIIQTVGIGETRIAEAIDSIVESFPSTISIAYLPSVGSVKLRLTGKGDNENTIQSELEDFTQQIVNTLDPKYIFGFGNISLAESLQKLCINKNVKVATAESCTGGGISHRITAIPGSSAYFMGTVVSYANDVKTRVLGVSQQTIDNEGAVSESTVVQMVKGVTQLMNVDVSVAVSGIAGPEGGTPDKPVGTIWLAVGNEQIVKTKKLQLVKDRKINIDYTIVAALNELRLFVEDNF